MKYILILFMLIIISCKNKLKYEYYGVVIDKEKVYHHKHNDRKYYLIVRLNGLNNIIKYNVLYEDYINFKVSDEILIYSEIKY